MCGIAGIIAYRESSPPVDREELLRIREAMARRGPDGAGFWVSEDGKVGLAHRRLAIIDLSDAGIQPLATADSRLRIVFNGEIYNYRALRSELESCGYRFRTSTDTEVLLHLYDHRGPTMVHALRGMFAFAIWDEREKTLFMARDPFGIKPLYYADSDGTFRFASQVKALLSGGRIDEAPEPAGHVGFFVLGSVPEPFTMYRDIRALPAGHTLELRPGGTIRLTRYFDVAREFASAESTARDVTAEEQRELLRSAIKDSVAHHMVSDVPVGVFLSSGLDSSTIAALARETHGNELRSVTLGFEEYRGTHDDETSLAKAISQSVGTVHETKWISREAFEIEVENILVAMDQPSIDGVNTYFVSKAAAESGMKVALSGLGGDELFGGYPSFRDVPRIARLFGLFRNAHAAGKTLRKVAAPLLGLVSSPKYASLAEYGGSFPGAYLLRRGLYMPWEVERVTDPAFFEEGWTALDLLGSLNACIKGVRNDRQAVAALELNWYLRNQLLRDADWAGMAHSLEIRVPLIDATLFRALAPFARDGLAPTKLDAALTPSTPLPREILNRRKTGFSIPVHDWAKRARVSTGPHRQMRNWANVVYRPYKKVRVLALLTDAFGGYGGIALYNRDLLTSVCQMPESQEVVALPRLITQALEPLPPKLTYDTVAANDTWRYLKALTRSLRGRGQFDVILCCHINLFFLALVAKFWLRAPLMMFIYGIDAWSPQSFVKRLLFRHVDRFVSISDVTRKRFQAWADVDDDKFVILPNAIHSEWYGPGRKSPALISRYRLEGKVVLMTLGRLVSSERYKGFDEVLDAMPELVAEIPGLTYLIVGGGSDRERLERKAESLGILAHVRFAGLIREEEKADHYRLADAYVMPSRGEGFGFVLLEAMACGIPAVASRVDGGREAVRDGQLGILVDPADTEDVKRGIREALQAGAGQPPKGLDFFEFRNFSERVNVVVRDAVARRIGREQAA